MSMAIRERMRELAVLKAVGFRLRELFAFILAESFGLAAAGAAIGVGGAWLFYTHMRMFSYTLAAAGLLLVFLAVRFLLGKNYLAALIGFLVGMFFAELAWQIYTHDTITKMTNGILLTFDVTPR